MSARLDPEDLEALAAEATRMGLSLACLIGAMDDGELIRWMAGEDDFALMILSKATITGPEDKR
jgi:hypothetical protein